MESSFSPHPSAAPTTTAVALRFGLLAGLVSVVFSLILFLTKMDQSPIRWLGLVISIGAIWLAHNEFKKQNGGYMEYGQGLSIGTILSLVSGTLSGIFTYVYVTFVDTTYMQRAMDIARAQMEAKGDMPSEQIDQAMEISAKFMTGGALLIFSIVGGAFFGFILSLIISAITKNSRPEFE